MSVIDEPQDQVERLGYIAIGTTDLDAAVDFYTQIIRLHVSERRDGVAFLTGGRDHCWLRLNQADESGVQCVSYQVADHATLDRLATRVEAAGREVLRDDTTVRFTDPSGQQLELYCESLVDDATPPDTGIAFDRLLHAVWHASDLDAAVAFHRNVLGFKPSDYIEGAAAFLRCADRYHHSLALLAGPNQFNHVCIQVASLDDVMRARQHALRNGIKLRMDVLRHAPSGSIGIYMEDPAHGLAVEFCCGHEPVSADHQPRTLPMRIDTLDVWQTPLPELEPR